MIRSTLPLSTIALVAALGCGGRESGTNAGTSGSGTSSGADASSDVIAPVPCTSSTVVDAGTTLVGDAEVPVNHRAAPACCPARRGPAPPGQPYPHCPGPAGTVCPSETATTCSSDSECTAGANGLCFPWEGLVGAGGCSYDECFTDSNCGPKTPCLCRSSSTDNSANSCDVGGNCAVDSDCGPGGYCSPSPEMFPNPNVCWGSQPYYCHTASDLCINDSDCAPLDAGPPPPLGPRYACAYDAQDNRWQCTMAVCALP
jgi:hypothetical protein